MTPKELYRVTRRSLRFDAAKMSKGLGEKYPPLLMRWLRIPGTNRQMCRDSYNIPFSNKEDGDMSKAYREWYAKQSGTYEKVPKRFPGAARLREMREVERYLRDTWAPTPGFKYLQSTHPVRLAAQEKARTYEPHFMDDFRWRSGDATLPPPVEYAKPQALRRRRAGNEDKFLYGFFPETAAAPVQWEYEPPQLWMPDHMLEAEQGLAFEEAAYEETELVNDDDDGDWWETSKFTDQAGQYKPTRSEALSDPLVQMLINEGSYDEASELCHRHRAGFAQNSVKFYMEQRPDCYPQTLPGTVWVSQSSGTSEVKTQVRIRKKVA